MFFADEDGQKSVVEVGGRAAPEHKADLHEPALLVERVMEANNGLVDGFLVGDSISLVAPLGVAPRMPESEASD